MLLRPRPPRRSASLYGHRCPKKNSFKGSSSVVARLLPKCEQQCQITRRRLVLFPFKSGFHYSSSEIDWFNWFTAFNFDLTTPPRLVELVWETGHWREGAAHWTRTNSACKIVAASSASVASGICLQPGMRMTSSTPK